MMGDVADAMRQRIAARIDLGRSLLASNQDRIEAELARVCEAREQAAREAMADPDVWRKLRGLFPSPATLEGWGKR